MPLPPILGHDPVWERFRLSLAQGRLASTFLFVGPPGIGKRTFALRLAQCLLCETTPATELAACQTCPGCVQAAALSHPDLIVITRPDDKSFIPIELFIGDREHRMREGLCHDIGLKPFRGGRKVAIIDDADYLNQEGANCLLKTLEEPPADSVLILIGTSEQRQLPTIRSRCQIIRFAPLDEQILTDLLANDSEMTPAQIASVAGRAGGSLARAKDLADAELCEAGDTLIEQLTQRDIDAVSLAKQVVGWVEAAGKDASPRRTRLRQLLQYAADHYRQVMRSSAGVPTATHLDEERLRNIGQRCGQREAVAAADCLERCLDALNQVDANANLATLVTAWLDDLAERSRPSGSD